MRSDKKYEAVRDIALYFKDPLKSVIRSLSEKILNSVSEIRLRAGRPVTLTLNGENVFLSNQGQICYLTQHGLICLSENDIKQVFNSLCEHSVYAYSEQIRSGYINLKHGCRAGIAAAAVMENGIITNFTDVSSINIRIAAEYLGCASALTPVLHEGLLIAGPPSSGKTTVLRDVVRLISSGIGTKRRRVSVIDSRGEIAALKGGEPQNELGPLTDVISNISKSDGIEIALRTLGPEVIAFDEIGNSKEAENVLKCFNSGVKIITTSHSSGIDELKQRECTRLLLESGAIRHIALLTAPNEKITLFEIDSKGNILPCMVNRGVVIA